jgi:hypothetical protein
VPRQEVIRTPNFPTMTTIAGVAGPAACADIPDFDVYKIGSVRITAELLAGGDRAELAGIDRAGRDRWERKRREIPGFSDIAGRID